MLVTYKVLQINRDRDTNRVKLMGTFSKWCAVKNGKADLKLYDVVYEKQNQESSSEAEKVLNSLYSYFNNGTHPADYFGHSVTVSDIIYLESEAYKGYWFCNSFGWEEVQVKGKPAQLTKEQKLAYLKYRHELVNSNLGNCYLEEQEDECRTLLKELEEQMKNIAG